MLFTGIIGILFAAIVFFHYMQGFFSATISAILAIFAAVLAFSYHESIAESLLAGKVANIAHSMILIALFAVIYLGLRTLFDKIVPNGIMLPALIDRLGGAVMGAVAATFALGILAIAIEELPMGSNVVGYTKYDTEDSQRRFLQGRSFEERMNYDELKSIDAGTFDEKERVQLFPAVMIPGVDEIVVGTVAHLSETGSMQGTPLSRIHPDFLQEIYGQNIGIQGGVKHVVLPSMASVAGVFVAKEVNVIDSELDSVRGGRKPLVPLNTTSHIDPDQQSQTVQTSVINDEKKMLVVVRISFATDAAEMDAMIRLSPGSIRLVAKSKDDVFHDYYPIGTLEPGSSVPTLFSDKPDDYLLMSYPSGGARAALDAVFAVERDGFLKAVVDDEQRKHIFTKDGKFVVDDDAFIEVKRMFRESLKDQVIVPYPNLPGGPDLKIGSLHPPDVQKLAMVRPVKGPKIGSVELTFTTRSPFSEMKSLCTHLNYTEASSDYELSKLPFLAYVPPKYDPKKPMGLIVLINNQKSMGLPEGVLHEFDDGNTAFIVATAFPDAWWQRAGLALDAVYNMQQQYAINGNRVYLYGGVVAQGSNGLPLCVEERLGLNYPKVFSGMFIANARNFAPMVIPDRTLPAVIPMPPDESLDLAKQLPIIIASVEKNAFEQLLLASWQSNGFTQAEIMPVTRAQIQYPTNAPGWIADSLKILDAGSRTLGRPASTPVSK